MGRLSYLPRNWCATAILLVAANAFGQSAPPEVDRLLKPQKLIIELFHEPGVPRLEVEKEIGGRSVSLAGVFAPVGIQMEFVYRDTPIPKGAGYQRVLQLQTPSTESAWSAAILIAGEDTNGALAGLLSMMPDNGRRVAVIYANSHREMADPGASMVLSAAHELTHILNLHHGDFEGTSLTKDSTIEGYYSDPTTARWRLSAASIKHLRHAPDPIVRPGGVEFGVVLREHAALHQPSVRESFTIVNSLDEIGKKPVPVVARVIPARSLGPTILIVSELTDGQTTTRDTIRVSLAVETKSGSLNEIHITLTGPGGERDLRHLVAPDPERQELNLSVPLSIGENRISVLAKDDEGHSAKRELILKRENEKGKALAVILGVQQYTNVRPLKHTLKDAQRMRDLMFNLGLTEDRIYYKENPNLKDVRTGLGTWLRQQAGPQDVAFVYFAGHGAAEIDADTNERDNLSKYLLPVEAELANLYATALPFSDIAALLQKVKVRTLVVMLDACFSGAAGGRTVAAEGNRADSVVDKEFLKQAAGQGRVILSASGANEAAQEVDEFGHGVFTYYLLEGWSGKADSQPDGKVDLLELTNWVTEQVRKKTGGKQRPGIWGEVREPVIVWRRPEK